MDIPRYPADNSDERRLLDAHLDFCRATMRYKFDGLTDELGKKRLGKTATSMLGVLKHMLNVEMWWFHYHFAGEECDFAWVDENPDGDFEIEPHETTEFLLAEYEKACQKSREICANAENLFDLSVRKRRNGKKVSLRWIYLHMIDETARHNGHLDIYRELLDGKVDCE